MRKAERTRVTAFVIHPGSPKSVPWDLDIPSGDHILERSLHDTVTPLVQAEFGPDVVVASIHVLTMGREFWHGLQK